MPERRASLLALAIAVVVVQSRSPPVSLPSEWSGIDASQLGMDDADGAAPPFREVIGGPHVDALAILRSHGGNTFRMRMWNDPCADGRCNATQYRYADLQGMLTMARRCHAAGLAFVLDLHYSDWWADPGHQIKPALWRSMDLATLELAVQNFTRNTVAALVAQGTPPAAVQIGNEISNGFLWPGANQSCAEGARLWSHDSNGSDPSCDIGPSWARFGALVARGIAGARAACQSCEIAIHTDLGNHIGPGEGGIRYVTNWYRNLSAHLPPPAAFDRIGLSMYPRWDGGTTMQSLAKLGELAAAFPGKAIYIAETAYPAKGNNAPEPGFNATAAGQLDFLQHVRAGLRAAVPAEQVGGVLWWEGSEGGNWQSVFDDDDVARPVLLQGFR